MLFRFFERLIDPVAAAGTRASPLLGDTVPDAPPPPHVLGFYWYFVRQAKGLFGLVFVTGLLVALADAAIPACIGRLIALLSSHAPERLWAESWHWLLGMGLLVLVLRPLLILAQQLVTNQAINPAFTSLIRWQSHFWVARQGLPFFQEDFAGRIANRVMQAGPALRESVVMGVHSIWYILVYGTSALVLLGSADWRLAAPILLWFLLYALQLRILVPRLRARSQAASAARSAVTGKVVDSYTNIQTVKLFASAKQEDDFIRGSLLELTQAFRMQLRTFTVNSLLLALLNAALLVSTAIIGVMLWRTGHIGIGVVATALPMAWQIANISGWVAMTIAGIFENIGVVQEATRSIAKPPTALDAPGARPLRVSAGAIHFQHIRFGYGQERGVLEGLDLNIRAGERVGLVGHSGAGKSTLVNLLLRFFEPEKGRILIDGQDIAGATQESLRAAIGVVTQDTALLHRTIRENIAYGRPDATLAEIEAAAERAEAAGFIAGLEDWQGRLGYDAHVGERGVKLSGGQRQRIAIARVLLKDAPILILDEATSALDSEVEAAIQQSLDALMTGKTVLAIAHRLSTLAQMDRLVVLEHGRIVEQGTHTALLAANGAYARLWARQSGSFTTT